MVFKNRKDDRIHANLCPECNIVFEEVSNLYCTRLQAGGGGEGVLPSRTAWESSLAPGAAALPDQATA